MLNYHTKTLNILKRLLLKQRKEVKRNLKEVSEDDPAKTPVLAESSEPGTDSYIADSHNKILVFQQKLRQASESITKALQKIRSGTYGKCEKCNLRIEISRLMVMPTAALCLSCSKKTTSK